MFRVLLMLGAVFVLCPAISLRLKRQTQVDNTELEKRNNCFCVKYYLCVNGCIVVNGENIFDERYGSDDNKTVIFCEGGEFRGEEICCTKCPSNSTVSTETDNVEVTTIPNPIVKSRVCGNQLPNFDFRIDNNDEDNNAMNGEFPWLAIVYKRRGNGWVYHCVGSLIHPKVILTVNHYVRSYDATKLKVLLSPNVELNSDLGNSSLVREVENIIKNPEYYSGGLHNDVAMLVLKEPYDLYDKKYPINTICLKPQFSFENERCLTVGWGQTFSDKTSSVLKKVELPIVNRSRCQELLRKTRLGDEFELHESHLCAGGEYRKDACYGDGGAPLMCFTENKNILYQVGMVSWGVDCGKENVPGIYADVSHSYDWIVSELSKRNITI